MELEECTNPTCNNFAHRMCVSETGTIVCHTCASPEESSVEPPSAPSQEVVATKRKKGGRKPGTTDEFYLQQELSRKTATNEIVKDYVAEKDRVQSQVSSRQKKQPRVAAGFLKSLVDAAKSKHEIVGEFDVSLQLINNRIESGKHEVWHPGTSSPVLETEVILLSFLINGWKLGTPLSKTETIRLMNHMIEGTTVGDAVVEFKKKHSYHEEGQEVCGKGWYRGFFARNRMIIEANRARKYANNRAKSAIYSNLEKMYTDRYQDIVDSGNAVLLDEPVLMDLDGNTVTDETLAYGLPTTIKYTHPENVFFLDETGENTCETGDGAKGGQLFVVPAGEVPKQVASTKDCHFTVTPVTNALGELCLICIIFKGEKLRASDAMGIDVFADAVEGGVLENSGPGKRHPGGPTVMYNGIEVPALCAASPNASMTGAILMSIFKTLDDLKITKRGNGVYPAAVVDGHFTRLTVEVLTYLNDEETKWFAGLGAINATDFWQLHDDETQNLKFAMEMVEAKTQLIRRKRLVGLSPNIERYEIVLLVNEATENSFNDKDMARKGLARRGWNPPNFGCLDNPEILESAPPAIKQQRAIILKQRQCAPKARKPVRPPPSETDLLQVGSGRLLGGDSSKVAATAANLNLTGGRAGEILEMAQVAAKTNATRSRAATEQSTRKPLDELKKALSEAKRVTAGVVVSAANGRLCKEVADEVHKREEYRKDNEAAQIRKKKSKLRELKEDVNAIRWRINTEGKDFKLGVKELKKLCKYKKKAGDPAIPGTKAPLLARWKKDQFNPSPHVSPANSFDDLVGEDLADVQSLADSETSAFDNEAHIIGGNEEEQDEDESDEEEEEDGSE